MDRLPDEIIQEKLRTLSPRHQFIFSVICCERIFPLFKLCYEGIESESPYQYGQCLDDLWKLCAEEFEGIKLIPKNAILDKDYEEEKVNENTIFWRDHALGALSAVYGIEDEIPIDNMLGCCSDICSEAAEHSAGFQIEDSFRDKSSTTGNTWWGYHDQPKMLQEWGTQLAIAELLAKYPLDPKFISRIRKYSQDHPVLGVLEARYYLLLGDTPFLNFGKELTAMVIDLEHAVKEGGIPNDLEKCVIGKLAVWNAAPYMAAGIWETTQSYIEPVLEPVQEFLVSAVLAVCRIPMLEYMMHKLADWTTHDEERAFALKMLAKCSPFPIRKFRSDAHKPPPLPPLPPDVPGTFKYKGVKTSRESEYFKTAILDALDILSFILDPQITSLIERYVDFPIPEVAEHAGKCMEKRRNFWNAEIP